MSRLHPRGFAVAAIFSISCSFFLAATTLYAQSVPDQVIKALKLIELGNPKQSLSDLQGIANANPKNADVLGAEAIAMIENSKPLPDVQKTLDEAYDIDHKSVLVRTARGMLFAKQSNRDDAVKEFRQALKIDPKNVGTYLSLARFYISADSLKAAEITLYQAQAVNANDVRSYIGLAELFEREHTNALAIEQYEAARNIDPADMSIHSKLAGLYYRSKQYDQSVNEWIKITKMDSTYAPAYLEIAKIFFWSRQYTNAAFYANKYVTLMPNDIQGIWLGAQALAESNQYQKALPLLETVSANDSLKPYAQLYLARSYFFSKDFAKANTIFSASKSLGPDDLYYWGYSLISSGDTVGGITKWEQSLVGDTVRKKEDKIKVYEQIISLLSSEHRWGDAASEYLLMNSVQFSEDNIVKAGQLDLYGKLYDSAEMDFEMVIRKDPKNVNALIGLADVAMKSDTGVASAEKYIEQAASYATTADQKESVGEAYGRLGIQYYTLKQFEKCVDMLEVQHAQKYLSAKSPYLMSVYKVLAAGYLQQKKFSKAEEYYKKVLQIDANDDDAKKGVDFIKAQGKGKK